MVLRKLGLRSSASTHSTRASERQPHCGAAAFADDGSILNTQAESSEIGATGPHFPWRIASAAQTAHTRTPQGAQSRKAIASPQPPLASGCPGSCCAPRPATARSPAYSPGHGEVVTNSVIAASSVPALQASRPPHQKSMEGCASTADLQGTNRAQIQLSGGRLQIGIRSRIESEFAIIRTEHQNGPRHTGLHWGSTLATIS